MKQFLCLLLAALLRGSVSSPDQDRLLQRLFDPQYQKSNVMTAPLRRNNDTLNVTLDVSLRKILAVDDVAEVVKLQYNLYYEWEDYRLQWNESDYDGLSVITTPSNRLWTPRLLLLNNAKQEISPETDYVFVYSDGRCVWAPRYEQSAIQCDMDLTLFPFDKQICSLVFASWQMSSDNIRIDPKPGFDNQTHFVESQNWQFLGIDASKSSTDNYPELSFTIRLRRIPSYYVLNIIVPCCLLSFIAVVTFLLQPNCYDRLALTVIILLAITVYQIIINNLLPTTSYLPVISMYVTFVFVLSVCVVLDTIGVLRMYFQAESKPLVAMPAWMKFLFCKCLAACLCMKPSSSPSHGLRLVYLNRGGAADDDDSPSNKYETISSLETTGSEPGNRILKEIRDLLKTRIRNEEQQRRCYEEETETKDDWMLAAAVLDRICFIAFAIIFVIGTIIFISIMAAPRD